jgi:type I restriction enzyme S subunit
VKRLDSFAVLNTKSVSPSTEPDSIFEHYSIPAFDAGEKPVFEAGESIKSNKYKVEPHSVLVSKLNPETSRIWLPNIQTLRAVCSTEFMQFVPKSKADRPYLFLLMKSETMQSEILQRVTGSTGSRQRAQPSKIAVLPVALPGAKVRLKFSEMVSPLLNQIALHVGQAENLATLRDTLLPKLLSGELTV